MYRTQRGSEGKRSTARQGCYQRYNNCGTTTGQAVRIVRVQQWCERCGLFGASSTDGSGLGGAHGTLTGVEGRDQGGGSWALATGKGNNRRQSAGRNQPGLARAHAGSSRGAGCNVLVS